MSDLPIKSADNVVDEQAYERAQEVIAVKPKRKWQSYIWDTFDKSPEERKFLFKIDTALLTLASFGMWNSIECLIDN
jgi:ACS family pantothenate transporter-like MFS transporter